jgi:transcriptional regulator with XRE-family HTH domain
MKRNMCVKEVAHIARLSVAHIYRLEKNKRPNASAVTIASVALALDTNVEFLLGITDDSRCIRSLFASTTEIDCSRESREQNEEVVAK